MPNGLALLIKSKMNVTANLICECSHGLVFGTIEPMPEKLMAC